MATDRPAKPVAAPKPDRPARPSRWTRLHLWQIQPVRDLLVVALLVGVVYIGYAARVVTIPMLLALFLAYLCEPLVRWAVSRRFLTRQAAAVAVITGAFFVVIVPVTLGTGFAAVQATKAARVLTDKVTRVQASVAQPEDERLREAVPRGAWRSIRDFVVEAGQRRGPEPVGGGPDPPSGVAADSSDLHAVARLSLDWLKEHGTELGQTLGKRVVGGGAEAVGAAVSATFGLGYLLFAVFLTAFFFYFFCTGWERILAFGHGLVPVDRRARTLHLLGRMDRVIAGFVRGRLIICCILGAYMTVAYGLAGVPAFLLLGPLVGALFIMPYVHVVGVPIAMLLMWLDQGAGGDGAAGSVGGTSALFAFERGWPWIVFAPIGIYLGAQLLDDYVLTPRIQGRTTDMSVPTILFASLAGGALGGLYGLLIAIPFAACVKILAQELLLPRVRAWVHGRAVDILPISRE